MVEIREIAGARVVLLASIAVTNRPPQTHRVLTHLSLSPIPIVLWNFNGWHPPGMNSLAVRTAFAFPAVTQTVREREYAPLVLTPAVARIGSLRTRGSHCRVVHLKISTSEPERAACITVLVPGRNSPILESEQTAPLSVLCISPHHNP